MTALQRQELDAFITTQFETKDTFYLSELTGHSRCNENFTINQHYLDRSVKSLIVCMKHEGNSFSSQTLIFGKRPKKTSIPRRRSTGRNCLFYLKVHQTQQGTNENREFLSHVYIKWQLSVSICENVHMLVWGTSLATCTGDASLKNLTVVKPLLSILWATSLFIQWKMPLR